MVGSHNIIIQCVGSAGDVLPLLSLGRELCKHNAQITVITTGEFRERVESCGFRFVEVGTRKDYETLLEDPRLWNPNKALDLLIDVIANTLQPCVEAINREIDLCGEERVVLIGTSLAFAARVVREQRLIPMATVHLAPSCIRSYTDSSVMHPKLAWFPRAPYIIKKVLYNLVDWSINQKCAALYNQLAHLNISLPRNIFYSWWNSPDCVLALWPEWFAPRQFDWPEQTIQGDFYLNADNFGSLTPSHLEWLDAGDAPLAFLAGSANKHASEYFAAAVKTCQSLGRRGILLTKYSEQLPDNLPDNVRHIDWAPLNQLLPRCAAMIHHGGIGTTSAGFAAGIPQIITPLAYDQFDNATRIKRLGVGNIVLNPTASNLKQSFESIITSNTVYQRCQTIQNQMSDLSHHDTVCQTILDLKCKN